MGYALITGLVGPIVNLLIGYFVGSELNAVAGWNFRATWIIFMLLPAVLTALSGYFGVKFGTRVGVVLGGLELLIFIALSIWMFAHATASGSPPASCTSCTWRRNTPTGCRPWGRCSSKSTEHRCVGSSTRLSLPFVLAA